jgi:hypothetical protein
MAYDDPVTVPAADLAENPYWKRDVRRGYAIPSTVTQGDIVGLLAVGSAKAPKEDVLQIGEAGAKQLVEVKSEGEKGGLAVFFEKKKDVGKAVLGEGGLPPMPVTFGPERGGGDKKYELLKDQSYGNDMEYV